MTEGVKNTESFQDVKKNVRIELFACLEYPKNVKLKRKYCRRQLC